MNKANARAAGGLIAVIMGLVVVVAVAMIHILRWFFGALSNAFGADLVARATARRELASLGVAMIGVGAAITIAAIQTRTEWHVRYAEYGFVTLPAAAAIAGATAIFAWTQLSGGGRPLRWARSLAFALAYGATVVVALVARYDSPTLSFARDALAQRDYERATLTAQTIIETQPTRAPAASVILDDVLDARVRESQTLASSVELLARPWNDSARRRDALSRWSAHFDRAVTTALAARDSTQLELLSGLTQRLDADRTQQTRALAQLVARSRTLPTESSPCDTTLPAQGPHAVLATEYRTRVRDATRDAHATARGASATSTDWDRLALLAQCSSQLGDAPPVELAAIRQQATTLRQREAAAAARAAASAATEDSGDSGGDYGGYGSVYVRGHYPSGRYVRGYRRRR